MKKLLLILLLTTGCAAYKLRVEYPECVVPSKTSTRAVEIEVTPQVPRQADSIINAILSLF